MNLLDSSLRTVVGEQLVPILTHVPELRALQAITFGIFAQGYSSRRFLQKQLSLHKVDELLTRKCPQLRSLRLEVWERQDDITHGPNWWTEMLYTHMPKLRGLVTITVNVERVRSPAS